MLLDKEDPEENCLIHHIYPLNITFLMLVFYDITGSLAINWPSSKGSTEDRSNIHRKHDQLQPICLFVVNSHAVYTLVGWMDEMICAIQIHDNEDNQSRWGFYRASPYLF